MTNAEPAGSPNVQEKESSTKLDKLRKHRKYIWIYLAGIPICIALGLALRKYPPLRIPTIVVGVFAVVIMLLWLFPKWQVACLTELKPEKRFDRENAARQTISQIVGGLIILIGFYFTWESLLATQANLKIASEGQQANLKIASEGQITDRFTKAIEQLGAVDAKGNKNLEVRLGGIYSLERIARDAKTDLHWPIMEVLTTYIRKNAPVTAEAPLTPGSPDWPPKPPPDVQAILTVIGRRKPMYGSGEDQRLNLADTNLRGADLRYANLCGVDLAGADLLEANLYGTHFEQAFFVNTHFHFAHGLFKAHLNGATFMWADLGDAKLEGVDLRGLDLRRARNITQSQIDSAIGDKSTKIPANLHVPDAWEKSQ